MEKIGEIKARFAEAGERLKKASMRTEAESAAGLLENLEQTYREDTRSGVQTLIRRSEKQRETLEKETARIYQLQQYERDYEKEGLICGIDEVGRGPLAGPVVAGAVILPKDCEILYLNDSKKLSASRREALYDEIMEKAVAVGVGIPSSFLQKKGNSYMTSFWNTQWRWESGLSAHSESMRSTSCRRPTKRCVRRLKS